MSTQAAAQHPTEAPQQAPLPPIWLRASIDDVNAADAPPISPTPPPTPTPPIVKGGGETLVPFAGLLRALLREFNEVRTGPFQKTDPLWNAMSEVKTRLEKFPAVQSRPDKRAVCSVNLEHARPLGSTPLGLVKSRF
jgi:hypothetical protein